MHLYVLTLFIVFIKKIKVVLIFLIKIEQCNKMCKFSDNIIVLKLVTIVTMKWWSTGTIFCSTLAYKIYTLKVTSIYKTKVF